MITFLINGAPASTVMHNLRLQVSGQPPDSEEATKLLGFLDECAAVIGASLTENVDLDNADPDTWPASCPICGDKITKDNYHHDSLGCDECTELALTSCVCCSFVHELDYLAANFGLVLVEG